MAIRALNYLVHTPLINLENNVSINRPIDTLPSTVEEWTASYFAVAKHWDEISEILNDILAEFYLRSLHTNARIVPPLRIRLLPSTSSQNYSSLLFYHETFYDATYRTALQRRTFYSTFLQNLGTCLKNYMVSHPQKPVVLRHEQTEQ
jgi:hypothetical protein